MSVNERLAIDPALLVRQSFKRAAAQSVSEFRLQFEHLRVTYPDEVAKICVCHIAEHGLDEVGRKVMHWLCTEERYLFLLLDPKLLPIDSARAALELFQVADTQFSPKFFKLLSLDHREFDASLLPRALELLVGLRSYDSFVPHLQALTRHSDVYIRSKAVKALCRIRPNKSLVERHSQCGDARVRSNALEAIWHINTDEAKSIFEGSLTDTDHRVVLNAALGLYFLNDSDALDRMLKYAEHESIRFRRAAVWALGLIADPRSRGTLERLLSDSSPIIKTNAGRALAKLPAEPVQGVDVLEASSIVAAPLAAAEKAICPGSDEVQVKSGKLPPENHPLHTPAFQML